MNSEQNIQSNDLGTGYIIVRAYTADNAIPLPGVKVKISDSETSYLLYNLITDSSGKTEKVSVKVPLKELSTFPNDQDQYGKVNIEVALQGYYPMAFSNVPLFDGITATQNASMIPISDDGTDYIFNYNENMLFDTEENSL